MMLRFVCMLLLGLTAVFAGADVGRSESFDPAEPFAAIEGRPIFHGEIDWLLSRRLKIRDPRQAPAEVRRATAVVIVRQHLALRTLLNKGGQTLRASMDQALSKRRADLKRRGLNFDSVAQPLEALGVKIPVESLVADFRWNHVWQRYLRSRLTDKNLRIFFERNKQDYGGRRYFVSQIVLKSKRKQYEQRQEDWENLTSIVKEVRQAEDPASAFVSLSQSTGVSDSQEPFWVSQTGDLPRTVFQLVRTAPEPDSVLGPVTSPLGTHLLFVHQAKEIDIAFDALTDHTQLRHDATNALFEQLIREQAETKVQWFVEEFKPRESEPLIPAP